MSADQLAGPVGQLTIPVGQQYIELRAGFPAGARDEKRTEGFPQLVTGAGGPGLRPIQRHA